MRHPLKRWIPSWKRGGLLVLLLGLIVGCTTPHLLSSRDKQSLPTDIVQRREAGKALKVTAESSGIAFNESDNKAARDRLMQRMDDLIAEKRYATAQTWARRFPEVSLDILQTAMMEEPTDSTTLQIIAATYDQQCHGGQGKPGWSGILAKRQTSARHHAPYAVARKELIQHLNQGRAAEAAAVPLPSLAQSLEPQLQMDAWHLVGMAQLLSGENEGAIESLSAGLAVAERYNPHQAAELSLLLSDVYRRVEQYDEATSHWQQGVLIGGDLLASDFPLRDPSFWDRASYLRPVDQRWPQAVEARLVAASGLNVNPPAGDPHNPHPSDAAVWACLGRWRLDRDQPQEALITLKRAETIATDPKAQEQIRMAVAQAMFRMEQTGAATALLLALSQSQHPEISSASQAMLGSIKLQTGHIQVGHSLLSKALKSGAQWPGRGEAEADLGLALLMLGNEKEGLARLHSAQRWFEAQGDHELLTKTLYNESEYHKSNKRKKEAAAPAERIAAIEQSAASLPPGMAL